MALDNEKDLLKLKALLTDVNNLRKQFGEGALEVNFAQASANTMEDLLQMQKKYKDALNEINDSWGTVSGILKDIKQDFGKATDGMKVALSSFNRLQSISNKFTEDALGIQKMSKKEIEGNIASIKKEIRVQQEALTLLEEKREAQGYLSENEEKMVEELKSENIQNNIALDRANKRLNKEKDILKTMGLTGTIISGVTKSLGKLGFSSTYFEGIEENMRNAAESGSRWKTAMVGIEGVAKGIGKALSDPLVILTIMYKTVKGLISLVSEYSKGVSNVGKGFGIAGKEAENTYATIRQSQDLYHFPNELLQGQLKYNEAVGFNLAYNKENAAQMQDLTQYLGLSDKAAGNLMRRSKILGTDFKVMDKNMTNVTNQFNKQNKTAVPYAKVLEKVSNASSSTLFNIRGGVKGLAEAGAAAARYGREMEDIKNSAQQLLNFEDSISKELEAELFLGKDLNLEKLRYAALTGDIKTAEKEQSRLIMQNWKGLKGNVLAQEAFAKSLGMSVNEVARIAEQQEIERKLTPKERIDRQATLKLQAEQAKEAETFNRQLTLAINSLKTALLPLVKAITPFFQVMAKAVASISTALSGETGKTIVKILGYAAAGGAALWGVSKLGSIFSKGGGGLLGNDSMIGGNKPGTAKGGLLGRFFGGKLGTSATNPMYVWVVNGGGGGMGMGNEMGFLGNGNGGSLGNARKASFWKKLRSPGTMLRALGRNLGKSRFGAVRALGAVPSFLGSGISSVGRGISNIAGSVGSAGAQAAAGGGSWLSKAWGGIKGFAGKAGNVIGKGLGGVKSILGGPIAKGFGKALGPIFAAISGISAVSNVISSAKDQKAKGQKVDFGSVGKKIVQAGAYPIANLATNLIPGVGTAISIADGILGAFNMSPIKWITDNLIDLVPNDAFTGLGKLAVGEKAMAIGGIVNKPTRALVGEAGPEAVVPLDKFYAKLDELIAVVKQGGNVYLDATKVGTAMTVGTYKVQ